MSICAVVTNMTGLNFMKTLITCGCVVLFLAKGGESYETPCNEHCKCYGNDIIICDKVGLHEIPRFVDKHLNIIKITLNDIPGIKNGDFSGVTNLKHLYMTANNIKTVNQGAFSGLKQLQVLSLDSNKISSLDVTLFESNSILTEINLKNNNIIKLDEGLFKNLSKLKYLYLDNNRLVHLKPRTFTGLTGLEKLNLDGNIIEEIVRDVFNELEMLEKLTMSDNRISKIDAGAFANLSRLKFLNLNHNRITYLDIHTFNELENLENLSMDFNSLSYIRNNTFMKLRRLRNLSIRSNSINTLEPSAFSGLNNLQHLRMSNNLLKLLDPIFFTDLRNLKSLGLSHNKIYSIGPYTFKNAIALETVYLRSNNIRCIHPDAFATNSYLIDLELSNNSNLILPTHHSLLNSKNLKILNLSKCRIKSLPSTIFENTTKLERILLHSNEILVLGIDPFKSLLNLTLLDLFKNPLECDCKLKPLWVYLLKQNVPSIGICKTPSEYGGYAWDVFGQVSCYNYSEKGHMSDSEVQDCKNFDYTVIPEDDGNVLDRVQVRVWLSAIFVLLFFLVVGGLYLYFRRNKKSFTNYFSYWYVKNERLIDSNP